MSHLLLCVMRSVSLYVALTATPLLHSRLQGGMGGSMIVPPGGGYVGGGYMGGGYGTSIYASATGAAMMGMGVARRGGMQSEIQPSYMIGSGGSVVGGEYRTPGARRFSTKYERRDTAGPGHSQPMSPGGGAYGQPMSPGGGAYGLPMSPGGAGYGQPMSPGGAAYGHAPYGRNSIAASYSLAFTGRDSAAISHLHPQPEIELHEDNYQLARMSTKMMSAGGAAGSGSAAGSPAGMTAGRKSPSLPRPAAAVTGRSVAQVAAELGLESPSGAAGHSVTWGAGAAGAPPPAPVLAGAAAAAAAAAHGAGADVYGAYENPELVPDNASAFINPLAMMAGESSSSDDDAAVAPSVAAARRAAAAAAAVPRAATGYKSWTQEARMASKQELSPSSTAGGSGSAGGAPSGGGAPSTVGAAHASSSYSHSQVWGGMGAGAAAAQQPALPAAMLRRQQAQQAAVAQQGAYQSYGAATTDDDTEDGEDLLPSERRRRGGGGSTTSAPLVALAESGAVGGGTLVIPVASQHLEGEDE